MKTKDEREMLKTTKEKKAKTEKSKGNGSYSERLRSNRFCCAFKLGFVQLICKASLIFQSSLVFTLSIILKQRQLYNSKHVAVECRCLKIHYKPSPRILFNIASCETLDRIKILL